MGCPVAGDDAPPSWSIRVKRQLSELAGHIQFARQIGAQAGLMFSDQIESDAAIYVARRSATGNAEVSGVYFAHRPDLR